MHVLRCVRVSAIALASVLALPAQTAAPAEQTPLSSAAQPAPVIPFAQPRSSFEEFLLNLPVVRYFTSLFDWTPVAPTPDAVPASTVAGTVAEAVAPCSVAALDPIEDPAAQALEAESLNSTQGVVDVADMVPAAARALDRFQSKVQSVGGTMVLKSAYRPSAYQKHLQNVWYKWMDELRNNQEPACQALRAQVQEEFTRHHLIETQHPVAVSDHTRGLAFDATVDLPHSARVGRRRVTLDGLAHLAGLVRPAIVADPVHFKFLGFVKTRRG